MTIVTPPKVLHRDLLAHVLEHRACYPLASPWCLYPKSRPGRHRGNPLPNSVSSRGIQIFPPPARAKAARFGYCGRRGYDVMRAFPTLNARKAIPGGGTGLNICTLCSTYGHCACDSLPVANSLQHQHQKKTAPTTQGCIREDSVVLQLWRNIVQGSRVFRPLRCLCTTVPCAVHKIQSEGAAPRKPTGGRQDLCLTSCIFPLVICKPPILSWAMPSISIVSETLGCF